MNYELPRKYANFFFNNNQDGKREAYFAAGCKNKFLVIVTGINHRICDRLLVVWVAIPGVWKYPR
jgi:hypothetical protein